MSLIYGLIGGIVLAVVLVIILAVEDHDKRTLQEQGLPPKKYGDITDHEVTTVYTIRHKKD